MLVYTFTRRDTELIVVKNKEMKLIQEHIQNTIAELSSTLQLMLSGNNDSRGIVSDSCEQIIGAIRSLSQASILINNYSQKQKIQDTQTIQLISELREIIARQKKCVDTLKNELPVSHVDVGVNTLDDPDWVSR